MDSAGYAEALCRGLAAMRQRLPANTGAMRCAWRGSVGNPATCPTSTGSVSHAPSAGTPAWFVSCLASRVRLFLR